MNISKIKKVMNMLWISACLILFAATSCDKDEKKEESPILCDWFCDTKSISLNDLSVEEIQNFIKGKWGLYYGINTDDVNTLGGIYKAFYNDHVIFEDLDNTTQTFYCTWEKRKFTVTKFTPYSVYQEEIEAFVLCRNNDKDEFIFFDWMADTPSQSHLYVIIGFEAFANIHVVYHRFKHWNWDYE